MSQGGARGLGAQTALVEDQVWLQEPASGDSANSHFQGSDSLWPLWTPACTAYTDGIFLKTEQKRTALWIRVINLSQEGRAGAVNRGPWELSVASSEGFSLKNDPLPQASSRLSPSPTCELRIAFKVFMFLSLKC